MADNSPEITEVKAAKTPVKVTAPIFQDFKNTVDGRVWGSLTSQGQKIPVCSKCGSKRLCDTVEVEAGIMIATLRCPNDDPNCSFIQSHQPNKSPYRG